MQHKTWILNNYLNIIQKMRFGSSELLLKQFWAMLTFEVTGGGIWAIYICSKKERFQACLTKGFYAYDTRWHGLESYLIRAHFICSKHVGPQVLVTLQ